jgi:hypothetical protein
MELISLQSKCAFLDPIDKVSYTHTHTTYTHIHTSARTHTHTHTRAGVLLPSRSYVGARRPATPLAGANISKPMTAHSPITHSLLEYVPSAAVVSYL